MIRTKTASPQKKERRPVIALTMGDPSGIGPEVIVKILSDRKIFRICRPLVVGDSGVIRKAIKLCRVNPDVRTIHAPSEGLFQFGTVDLLDLGNVPRGIRVGKPRRSLGRPMVEYIQKAVDLALKGAVDAVTTAPINKTLMNQSGFKFPGHTELLAHLTKTKRVAMMLVGGPLRITLATTHLPIVKVPRALSRERILNAIQLTHKALQNWFRIRNPKIAVASLNPHGGEDTLLGAEEKRVIGPAIGRARRLGVDALGPLPPDTLFYQANRKAFDAVVVMYHDQGLIPLKMVSFGKTVNVTLGLPILRTSVDHGTAYDIAGLGKANAGSLFQAVFLAAELAMQRTDKKSKIQ